MLEQPRAGIEFVGRRRGDASPRAGRGARLHDESAADAVVLLARQHLERGVVRGEAHAVGVPGQHLIDVEQQIQRLVEGDFMAAEQPDAGPSMRMRCKVGSIDGRIDRCPDSCPPARAESPGRCNGRGR